MKRFIVWLMVLNLSSCGFYSKKEGHGRKVYSVSEDLNLAERDDNDEDQLSRFGPYIDRPGKN